MSKRGVMMENEEYTCYEIRLNRFFNIQRIQNLLLLGILLLFSVGNMVINEINHKTDIKENILGCCICLIIMSVKLLSHSSRLEVTPETVKFQYNTALISLLLRGRIFFLADGESKYTKVYTVYNIKTIEYCRTPFEKIFSCGHIRICGDVSTDDRGKEQREFIIYGVQDFENTSTWMKGYIKIYD